MDTGLLVTRAAGGDTQAFGELVDPIAMRLLLFIRTRGRRLLGSDCDAEDVLQTVLVTAWRKLGSFEYRGAGSFYGWLVAIARGALGDRIKYLKAKGRGGVGHVESKPGVEAFDPGTSLTKLIARKDEFERACRVLETLDPGQREVVERHLLEAETLSQIAGALGISKSTAWERLHKGMERLRAGLEGDAA
jgi:RNA polymerase sigma-70 factor (ECF subfamily)